jgi:molybdopterin-guanine dinucleotide biosynthesis protein A
MTGAGTGGRSSAAAMPGVGIATSGIVLAGGKSSRFGSDKLAARMGDRTLLDRAVAAVAAIVTEVVVVVGPGDDRRLAPVDRPVRIVRDPESNGGPLVGLLAGLEAVDESLVVVAGGDMPFLRPEVLALLTRTLAAADPAVGAVALRSRNVVMPLPVAVRTGAATDVARRLVGDGERSLRSLLERLTVRVLEEADWRPFDPDGATLRDVDQPADLAGG